MAPSLICLIFNSASAFHSRFVLYSCSLLLPLTPSFTSLQTIVNTLFCENYLTDGIHEIIKFQGLVYIIDCAAHSSYPSTMSNPNSILDDTEFYDKQEFFTLAELQELASLLNHIIFVCIWESVTIDSSILSSCRDLLSILYDRNTRRQFTPQDHWLIKSVAMVTVWSIFSLFTSFFSYKIFCI